MTNATASRNHIRAMWNLMTDLMIEGRHQDAKAIREAIRIAEAAELDSGRF